MLFIVIILLVVNLNLSIFFNSFNFSSWVLSGYVKYDEEFVAWNLLYIIFFSLSISLFLFVMGRLSYTCLSWRFKPQPRIGYDGHKCNVLGQRRYYSTVREPFVKQTSILYVLCVFFIIFIFTLMNLLAVFFMVCELIVNFSYSKLSVLCLLGMSHMLLVGWTSYFLFKRYSLKPASALVMQNGSVGEGRFLGDILKPITNLYIFLLCRNYLNKVKWVISGVQMMLRFISNSSFVEFFSLPFIGQCYGFFTFMFIVSLGVILFNTVAEYLSRRVNEHELQEDVVPKQLNWTDGLLVQAYTKKQPKFPELCDLFAVQNHTNNSKSQLLEAYFPTVTPTKPGDDPFFSSLPKAVLEEDRLARELLNNVSFPD